MLTLALAPSAPAIEMSLVPGSTPDSDATAQSGLSVQQDCTLIAQLYLDAGALDLSDTGGTPSGESDTSPLVATLVEGTDYYLAPNVTVQTIGVDIYVSWDSPNSQWVMTVNTNGGLSWTGIGSSSYDNPLGTYYTASYTDAGSGYVVVS